MKATRPGLFRPLQVWLLLMMIGVPAMAQESSNFSPLEYIQNKGQWEGDFLYKADLGGAAIFVKKNGFRFLLLNKDDLMKIPELNHGHMDSSDHKPGYIPLPPNQLPGKLPGNAYGGVNGGIAHHPVRGHAYDLEFLNTNTLSTPQIEASKPTQENINYLIGNDRSKWQSGVGAYTSLLHRDLYKNVDLQIYSEGGQMKYDLIVHPGGDPDVIRFAYTGATSLALKKGNLHIQTSVGEAIELAPFAYQYINNERKRVNVSYQLSGTTVSFKVSGKYDNSYPLVIDPTVVFATLTGSRADNWGFTATYDAAGNFYAGGIAFNNGYPVSTGAYDNSFNSGQFDMSITKFNAAGTQIIYSTYLGGSGEDQPHSLFVDGQGQLVISGRTNSGNYPVDTVYGPGGGFDIAVTKLNATGTGIVGSVKIGGTSNDGLNMRPDKGGPTDVLLRNYGDDARSEVVIDGAGNIYIASSTQSANFPASATSFQPTYGGGRQDAVIVKLGANVRMQWASFLGGSAEDAAYVLAVNGTNSVYVAGGTASSNFPARAGSIYPSFRGGACDGYITNVSANGATILQSTFMGSDNQRADQIYGIQLDRDGNVYVMGTTEGTWPILQPTGTATFYNDNSKQFISKLRPDLSAFIYSTTFGKAAPQPSISPVAFLVDRCQNVYVSGWGGVLNSGNDFSNSGTSGLPVTADARKPTSDNSDFYFFVLKRDALGQLYGTFYGGNGLAEHVDGGTSRFDQNGVIYQAICAACGTGRKPRFPTTPGAYNSGIPDGCNLGALKIAFNLDGVRAGLTTQERKRNYCVPATITFIDTTNITAQSWIWNFGDGTPEVTNTSPTMTHTYNTVGDYHVRMVKYDPASCNLYDTAFIDIRVRADQASVDFTDRRLAPCTALNYEFNNISVAPIGKPFTPTSFVWNFGDGSPTVTTDLTTQTHAYAAEGVYNVTLTLVDTNYCNAPEVITHQLRVAANVVALFEVPDSSCAPFAAVFDNTSKGGVSFNWDFGDGTSSTDIYPTHVYNTPGEYTVTMTATDPNTCNLTDDTTMVITVLPPPVAGFTYQPTKPVENTPHIFTNTSTGAAQYWWDFGDGDTSTLVNPTHQYIATGTYQVCLIAETAFGCHDTTCQTVAAIVNPLFDVPTAFSPNGDGINDKWEVKSFGVSKYDMKVFNRWGQLMFQSNDPRIGWDGRFQGTIQPMDAYAYILNIEFSDGKRATKNGNVTLLR